MARPARRQATTLTAAEQSFHILCVCTGNICRSPVAERLLASRLGSGIIVTSAGTYALEGQPISPPMDQFLADAGADPDGFRAQRLSQELLRSADLVLGLSTEHRGDAVELWPKTVRRSFTLKEFARLLEAVDSAALPSGSVAERLRASIPLAAAQRSRAAPPSCDDVVDPYRRGQEAYISAFSDVEVAVARIVLALSG